MSFQQGLSGLNTSARALDVTGNNVANSSTVGFKSSEAHFADIYAASLTGGSGLQIGIGTSLAAVAQQFTQGNISTTNNPLDIAINGSGFFRMSNNGAISYTRNGQFHLDKNGFFTNDQGLRLTGYPAASDGTIMPGTPGELQLTADVLKLAPIATGASKGGEYQGVRMSTNLDSRSPLPTTAWVNPPGPEPVVDVNTYNYTTGLDIYDSLGNPHRLSFYYEQTATAGVWNLHANVDGTSFGNVNLGAGAGNPVAVTFDVNGKMVGVTPPLAAGKPFEAQISVNLNAVAADKKLVDPTYPPNNANPALAFALNLTGSTQYGKANSTDRLLQDGYTSGNLAGLGVGADGIIQGRYTNGKTYNLGQMVLASFQNPNGLTNVGGNQWIETSVSGQPTVDAPGSGQMGAVQSNAVEESNVDLTAELVKMITQQRNYQANAQTIKTQDQVMQTLVNLR